MDTPGVLVQLVLGATVEINTFGCGLTIDEQNEILAIWRSAAAQLHAHADELSTSAKAAIAQVQEIICPASDATDLGDTGKTVDGKRGITLSLAYLRAVSTAWAASLLAHEGQHMLNAGKFAGVNLWQDEESACTSQLAVLETLGASEGDVAYLKSWMAPSNAAAMEAHMNGGYAGPPLQSA